MSGFRKCSTCKETFNLEHFAKGNHSSCKQCEKASRQKKNELAKLHPDSQTKSKVCTGCKIEKEINEFGILRIKTQERQKYCKPCKRERDNKTYLKRKAMEDNLRNEIKQSSQEMKKDKEQELEAKVTIEENKNESDNHDEAKDEVPSKKRKIEIPPVCAECEKSTPEVKFSYRNKSKEIFKELCSGCDAEKQRRVRTENEGCELLPKGMKMCKGECRSVKPETDFPWKSKSNGYRESKCSDCYALYQYIKRQTHIN